METSEEVDQVIIDYIFPSEVIGKVTKYGDEWRALVAVGPSGPLVLMAFKIRTKTPNPSLNQTGTTDDGVSETQRPAG